MNFKDKVALVTGGNKGIGRAISVALGRERAHVLLNFQSDFAQPPRVKMRLRNSGERQRS